MSGSNSFFEMMDRLKQSDPEAAARVFERYSQRLLALARSRLDERLRAKLDPEDITQSVFNSFFQRQAEGQFDLTDWDSLWSLLVVITLRKCGHRIEHLRAARRDVGREQPLAPRGDVRDVDLPVEDPTPSEVAQLRETLERVMQQLSDARERQILALSLQGCTAAEISLKVGRSERTVGRVLKNIRSHLQRLRDAEHGEE